MAKPRRCNNFITEVIKALGMIYIIYDQPTQWLISTFPSYEEGS